jgi:hypothetical protein
MYERSRGIGLHDVKVLDLNHLLTCREEQVLGTGPTGCIKKYTQFPFDRVFRREESACFKVGWVHPVAWR